MIIIIDNIVSKSKIVIFESGVNSDFFIYDMTQKKLEGLIHLVSSQIS